MKRTTIFADEYLIKEIKEISEKENKSVAGVIREAMEDYIQRKNQTKNKLSFIGVGNSGRRDISENHENLLWNEVPK